MSKSQTLEKAVALYDQGKNPDTISRELYNGTRTMNDFHDFRRFMWEIAGKSKHKMTCMLDRQSVAVTKEGRNIIITPANSKARVTTIPIELISLDDHKKANYQSKMAFGPNYRTCRNRHIARDTCLNEGEYRSSHGLTEAYQTGTGYQMRFNFKDKKITGKLSVTGPDKSEIMNFRYITYKGSPAWLAKHGFFNFKGKNSKFDGYTSIIDTFQCE